MTNNNLYQKTFDMIAEEIASDFNSYQYRYLKAILNDYAKAISVLLQGTQYADDFDGLWLFLRIEYSIIDFKLRAVLLNPNTSEIINTNLTDDLIRRLV